MRGLATGSFKIIYNVDEDDGGDLADLEQVRGFAVMALHKAGDPDASSQVSGTPRNVEHYRGRTFPDAPLYQDDLKTGSLRIVNESNGLIYVIDSISAPTSGVGHTSLMFNAHRVL